jgi:hypothetical protein
MNNNNDNMYCKYSGRMFNFLNNSTHRLTVEESVSKSSNMVEPLNLIPPSSYPLQKLGRSILLIDSDTENQHLMVFPCTDPNDDKEVSRTPVSDITLPWLFPQKSLVYLRVFTIKASTLK